MKYENNLPNHLALFTLLEEVEFELILINCINNLYSVMSLENPPLS